MAKKLQKSFKYGVEKLLISIKMLKIRGKREDEDHNVGDDNDDVDCDEGCVFVIYVMYKPISWVL